MFKRMKNIRPGVLIVHVIVTLAYPAVKAFRAANNRLLLFTDAMTIIGALLLIGGILYGMVLHGDFDISSYYLQRGVRSVWGFFARRGEEKEQQKPLDLFLSEAKEKREESFNYPLFLGIVYLLAAALIAFVFL